jgi:hypothetical protein
MKLEEGGGKYVHSAHLTGHDQLRATYGATLYIA